MFCKQPVLFKCCYCLPLREGLIVLAYVRLAITTLSFPAVFLEIRARDAADPAVFISVLALLVANFIFSIIFVFAAQKKHHKWLLHYYTFSKLNLAVFILLNLSNLLLEWIKDGPAEVFNLELLIIVLDVLIQFYFLAVIKSFILKVEDEAKTKRTNINEEADVVLDMPITEERDAKCDVGHSHPKPEVDPQLKSDLIEELKKLQQNDQEVQNKIEKNL